MRLQCSDDETSAARLKKACVQNTDMTQQQENWRKIIHVDMDAFFASVEQHDHPELKGLPVAVGHADGRGVVAAASYEARRFGVHSAMPSARARQLCPELVFVESRMARYREVSGQVHEIFSRYTDLIEPISIDEAFLDVTQNKPGIELAVDIARDIKASIKAELGLTASAGVSYNKLLAKIASDWRKPDGLCTIHPQAALKFIDQLKVEHLWGVGPATAKAMHEMGIETARELRAVELPEMLRRFGKAGVSYYNFVPVIVLVLVMGAVIMLAATAVVGVAVSLSSETLASWLTIPLVFFAAVVMYASYWPMYRDLFGDVD